MQIYKTVLTIVLLLSVLSGASEILDHDSLDFLVERVVFEDNIWATSIDVHRMDLMPDSGKEIIVTTTDNIIFLNKSYQETHRLKLKDLRFNTITPLYLNIDRSYGFLGYRYGKGLWLLDSEANEMWRQTGTSTTGLHLDGGHIGDLDGDGNPEFVVFYRYRDGIHLLDSGGNGRWKHPVYAMGHLEITDFNGDGKAEIMYSNSNNASGKTQFKILDSTGKITEQMEIATHSYEYEVVNWLGSGLNPQLLLTEENTIRIVDLDGQTLMSLDAPGCRPFGVVTAVAVKFEKDEPRYLAVKKKLSPDLSILYVFDPKGKLVYQKSKAVLGGSTLALAVIPVEETGDEKLLMGSIRNYQPFVLEYFLAGKTGRKDTPALKKTE